MSVHVGRARFVYVSWEAPTRRGFTVIFGGYEQVEGRAQHSTLRTFRQCPVRSGAG